MISVENLTKSFGGNCLLDDFSFRVNRKERIGLVGRNGHGKTTLLKMIAGIMEPDDGGINTPRNYRIGYVRQEIAFTCQTALEEGMTGLPARKRPPLESGKSPLRSRVFRNRHAAPTPANFPAVTRSG